MLRWIRSWFAWRFSLIRLVLATLFLGAFVGLNMHQISQPVDYVVEHSGKKLEGSASHSYYGWPLPFKGMYGDALVSVEAEPFTGRRATSIFYQNEYEWLPWTHQSYRLFGHCMDKGFLVNGAIIDALFALTVLSLTLLLQIPRRISG